MLLWWSTFTFTLTNVVMLMCDVIDDVILCLRDFPYLEIFDYFMLLLIIMRFLNRLLFKNRIIINSSIK